MSILIGVLEGVSMNVVLSLFPTPDSLLESTDVERERAVLLRVVEYCRDPMHPMLTRDVVENELFERGGYEYDVGKREQIGKVIRRAWKMLEDNDLVEEPDAYNGKNGYRVPTEKGKAVAAGIDLAGAKIRSRFTKDMFHPALPDSAWNAFRVGDYDTAVFEALKAVEIAVRKKGAGKNGITPTDFGVDLIEKAFHRDNGPLSDLKASRSRRQRRCEFFSGALGELRNPKAHSDPTINDPMIAIEEMMVASTLLRIVDSI